LKVGISPTAFPIYWCGAADAQAVGRGIIASSPLEHIFQLRCVDKAEGTMLL
jgi:hypothetical protein